MNVNELINIYPPRVKFMKEDKFNKMINDEKILMYSN